jgi:hypothetical protein
MECVIALQSIPLLEVTQLVEPPLLPCCPVSVVARTRNRCQRAWRPARSAHTTSATKNLGLGASLSRSWPRRATASAKLEHDVGDRGGVHSDISNTVMLPVLVPSFMFRLGSACYTCSELDPVCSRIPDDSRWCAQILRLHWRKSRIARHDVAQALRTPFPARYM